MFKAMMAAAGGKATHVPPPAPTVSEKKVSAVKVEPARQPLQPQGPSSKAMTFTQLRGPLPSQTDTKPVHKEPPKPSKVEKPKPSSRVTPRATPKAATRTAPRPAPRAAPKPVPKAAPAPVPPKPTTPRKRLNFTEMLSKAKQVDGQKLAMDIKAKSIEDRKASRQRSKPTPPSRDPPVASAAKVRPDLRDKPERSGASVSASANKLAPAPRAQPSKELLAKQKAQHYESDSSIDEFVVDDDRGNEYKSQIWEALGRRPRAVYQDDSDSDMEATHHDIYAEEERSRRLARQEDQREERRLAELAAAKLRRKQSR